MSTAYPLGTVTGLRFSARPSALIGALLLWIILSGVGMVALKLSPVEAILGRAGRHAAAFSVRGRTSVWARLGSAPRRPPHDRRAVLVGPQFLALPAR